MQTRPKILPSSLREKHRYLCFEMLSDKKIRLEDLTNAFWNSLVPLVGEISAAQSKVWFVKDEWDGQRGLLRCNHDVVEQIRLALALITDISGTKVIPHTLGVSGTIRAAKQKFMS